MRRLPIRLRLTAWYVVVLAVVLSALGAFVATRLRADLTAEVDRTVGTAATGLAAAYRDGGAQGLIERAPALLPGMADGEAGARVLDPAGAELLAVGRPGAGPVRTVAVPADRGGRRVVVVASASLGDVDDAVGRVVALFAIGGVAALALLGAGGWWLARGALRPVEEMTSRADAIDIADLSGRIAVPPADDELAHLARTLNAMLARLEGGVAARERLVADASHELRAPLAAMRAEVEVSLRHDDLDPAAREVLASVREEVLRLSRTVDDLLTLARVDGGRLDLVRAPLDLRDVADRAAARAPAGDVEVRAGGPPAPVHGDRDRLDQVAGNLLDNALRFAPPGSVVEVASWTRGGECGLTVGDDGPGVPEEDRERIFERFARADPARGRGDGAGLGLAICREIVLAHDGRIWVEPRAPSGSAFSFALPLSAARSAPPPATPVAGPGVPAR